MGKIIKVNFPGGKRVDAVIGDQLIRTDQSKMSGGDGSAPEPFQLFLASIATCAGIYALHFCQTRNIPVDGMDLTMDCEYDPEEKRYKDMKISLKLPAGFPEQFKPAIIRSMDLCAVKKHMIKPPSFQIGVE
ncbi:OsmC family protein [bacterium]|nr:OsmC family protein [bacterium]